MTETEVEDYAFEVVEAVFEEHGGPRWDLHADVLSLDVDDDLHRTLFQFRYARDWQPDLYDADAEYVVAAALIIEIAVNEEIDEEFPPGE